jgi:iron complex outermembrane recepter protein
MLKASWLDALRVAVLFAALLLWAPQHVFAQTAALASGTDAASPKAESFGLEEVVVTATRREENLQNVPASIAAMSGKQLEEQGIFSTTGIANSVPGLQIISPDSGTDNFFSIRGVTQNDYADHEESPIAVYIDGAYLSQSAGTAALLFDTDRVEVLRGPQGTLFGRNATGGLVQYISKQPTNELDGYVEATFGNYASKHFEAAVGDKITDGVSFRVSTALDYAAGYLTNPVAGDHPGNRNGWATRAQLRIQPNDDLQIDINLHGTSQRIRSGFYADIVTYPNAADHGLAAVLPPNQNFWGSCPGCDPAGYKVPSSYSFYTADSTYPGSFEGSTVGDTTTVKYSAGKLNITSISDITRFNKQYVEDSISSAIREANFISGLHVTQYSQELHVDNGSKDRFRWIAGAYYFHMDGHYNFGLGLYPALLTPLGLQGAIPNANASNYSIVTRSLSEFSQGEYDLARNVTAVLGVRWNQEDKSFNYRYSALQGYAPNGPPDPGIPPIVINQADAGSAAKVSEGDWSARAALDWHMTDAVMAYISWNKGTKAGGFNAPTFPLATVVGYKFGEEKLYATEIGVKGEFLDRKLQVDADVFHYDYQGYQAFNSVNFNYYITNLPSRIKGGELSITAAPVSGLRLNAGLALLDATTYGLFLPDGTATSRVNANSPRVSFTGSVAYRWGIANGAALTLGDDFSYRSAIYYSLLDDPAATEQGYWLDNAHLDYDSKNGHWALQARVENLFAQKYYTYLFPESSFGFTEGVFGTPRTFELNVKYRL